MKNKLTENEENKKKAANSVRREQNREYEMSD